ncbi:hypothetical protein HHI36_004608 [Cryptolaemus montrouzieri]|uniref:PiggyBac transposable element-derived protein domain-containing protein n=1 Tax=Cryptolaemus montrouzieri TaxID=559131 RepID=A0ABD2NRZ3_9CUCU
MGGVDKIDQLIAVYRSRIRQRKWWWPIFAYLLDASVVNVWILIRPNDARAFSLLQLRRSIAYTFLSSHGTPSSRGKIPKAMDEIIYDGRDHLPEYVSTKKLCRNCMGISHFICIKCKVGLHPKI